MDSWMIKLHFYQVIINWPGNLPERVDYKLMEEYLEADHLMGSLCVTVL
jgi:hypothetical protein